MRAPLRFLSVSFALLLGLTGCSGNDDSSSDPVPSSFASLVTPGTPRWRALAEAPEARQEVAAALLDGKVYVAGGLTASGATARVDIYDVAGDAWSDGPPLPVPLHHAMAAAFEGSIWVIGGFGSSGAPLDSVFRLSGSTWQEQPRLRRARAAGAAFVEANRLLVFGGQGAGQLVAPVEELVDGAWVDRAPIPTPRHHVAAASDGQWIYVSGGRIPAAGGPDRNVPAFERFSVAENRWQRLPDVPTPRSGHGSGFMKGRVLVTGGEDPAAGSGQPSIASTEAYDPHKGVWLKDLPGMFRARHGVGAITIDDKLYVFLGGSRVALAPTADSDVFIIP